MASPWYACLRAPAVARSPLGRSRRGGGFSERDSSVFASTIKSNVFKNRAGCRIGPFQRFLAVSPIDWAGHA
ncbi:hypothetical protein [Azospirillum argentinense]